MVRLDVVKALNQQLVKGQPLVAVFAGGTSGIGDYTVRALANTHADIGEGLRVYIIGRNSSAAESLVADCQRACPKGSFTFVKATDLSLLKDVDVVCDKVIDLERRQAAVVSETPRIDLLVMSHACPPWWPQKETTEGLDRLMSFMYYSRMRMTTKLLPLLLTSSMPAHVVSVYAAGCESKLIADDLSLRKRGNYSMFQARSHITYMKTLFMEALAERYRGRLSLLHVFPGLVITPAFDDPQMPYIFRLLWDWFGGIIGWLYAISADECGARTLSLGTPRYPARSIGDRASAHGAVQVPTNTVLGTDGERGSGAYAINWNGESIPIAKAYRKIRKDEMSRLVWAHTTHVFEQIEAGQLFEG